MKTNLIILLCVLLNFHARSQSNENSEILEARKAIEASNATYQEVLNKRDGTILDRYTKDACLLPPNSPILCGRDAMLDYFKEGKPLITNFTIIDVIGNGNGYVTEISWYEMFDLNKNKIDNGKIMVVWKKTEQGWKMYRDMFSSSVKR